ncbi:hypothetical protein SBA3_1930004 [Candidatus Sulfopaludibacter sp. SbA3]|nr:hypothetical protein SBA3_1930004 [Candidatus Sulfopaludibacter sp. SbA3]
MNARFTDVDRRLDRLTESVRLTQTSVDALNTWADRLDKDQASL